MVARARRRVEHGTRRLQAAQERLFGAVVRVRGGRELAAEPRSADCPGQQGDGHRSISRSVPAAPGAVASAARGHLFRRGTGRVARHASVGRGGERWKGRSVRGSLFFVFAGLMVPWTMKKVSKSM